MSNLDDWGTGDAPRPSRPDYVPKVALVPQTLGDLMQRVGSYADAAKAHLEWSAVTVWLMKEGNTVVVAAGLPSAVANLAVFLTRAVEEREAGWPVLSGIIVAPALYGYSEDGQCEARRSAAEARAIWEANGRPYLRASDCKWAFQYLVACIRSGVIPPVPTIGDVTPIAPAKPAPPHILNMFKENQ